MVEWWEWIPENWFSLVQSIGIVGGLLFTAWSMRIARREGRMATMLGLAQHHRELWAEAHRRPELSRLFDVEADLIGHPITVAEREFLDVAVYHFATCFALARNGGPVSLPALELDARSFFAKPLPRSVWKETRDSRDPRFVAFIEQCLERK